MFRRFLPKFAFLFCLLALGHHTAIQAGDPNTGNLIVLSGGQSDKYWRETEKLQVSGSPGYFALGSISLSARSVQPNPIYIEIWGRGLNKFEFFDLTPLVDGLTGVRSGQDIRALLLPAGSKDSIPAANDRERLGQSIAQNKSGKDAKLAWQRQLAYEQMNLLKLTSFDQLWPIYQRQREFVDKPWEAEITPETVLSLYGLAAPNGKADSGERFTHFIRTLGQSKLLAPILRTKLGNPSDPRIIGYILQLPENAAKKTSGQIFVAANGLSPETMLVSLEAERQESIFFPWSWTKFLAAILTPTITGLAGTLLGAVIGYLGFLAQQKYSRISEMERRFEEKKIENSATIRKFFTKEYPAYLSAQSEVEERQNVTAIRESFIQLGIFAILPRPEARQFNSICNFDRRFSVVGGRLRALTDLLERRFSDLMV